MEALLARMLCVVQVIGDGKHGKGRTNQYFRENYQMPLGRCFLHAVRLTIPHPSLFSAVCSAKKLPPTGSIGALDFPEIQSEQVLNNLFSLEDRMPGSVPPIFPKTLTLRASIPADLRQVLLALPDGLSGELLDSFEAAA